MRFLGSNVGPILAGVLGLASVASVQPVRKTAALSWVRAPVEARFECWGVVNRPRQ
jgi:hypothetical protein